MSATLQPEKKELTRQEIWEMWNPENFVHPSGAFADELDSSRMNESRVRCADLRNPDTLAGATDGK